MFIVLALAGCASESAPSGTVVRERLLVEFLSDVRPRHELEIVDDSRDGRSFVHIWLNSDDGVGVDCRVSKLTFALPASLERIEGSSADDDCRLESNSTGYFAGDYLGEQCRLSSEIIAAAEERNYLAVEVVC